MSKYRINERFDLDKPKRRDVAQIAVFTAEAEPIWRRNKMYPQGQEAVFGIVQRRDTLKSRYLTAAFLYALRGASHGIASRDFVCHRSPNHSRNRLTLWGRIPQSPSERRDVYGKRYAHRRPRDGKGEGKNSSKSSQMRAEYNRICEAKSVGVRAERGSAWRSFCLP